MEFHPKEINVKKLVGECIDIHRNVFESKQIQVVEDVKDFIGIFCDENMFKTVIRNLLSNAIKFTNPQGEVSIKAKVTDKVCIEIKDNGVGMSADTLEKLFRIGHKITTEGTMKERGTGLGLIMCKELIEKNGGSILVESEIGKGTTFKVIMNY